MTETYHTASIQPLFRIGGVYRQQNGSIVRLEPFEWADPECDEAQARFVDRNDHDGSRSLMTGRYEATGPSKWDLIPGELHQVNGEWVPAQQSIPFPSGSVLKTDGDKIVGRIEPQSMTPTLDKLANTSEPLRPGLTWNTPTTFMPFPDYIVTRGSDCDVFDIAPASKNALPANANLVKG